MLDWSATAALTFIATNLDDLLLLVVFFAQVGAGFRRRHVVMGQTLGFSALVLVSLLGFLFSLVIPRPWLGLLGFIPIFLGLRRLLSREDTAAPPEAAMATPPPARAAALPLFGGLLSVQTFQVAAVTVANGGDNIGVYAPLFARSSPAELAALLVVFFLMLGIWLLAGYRLTQRPAVAALVARYGGVVVPLVLIALGVLIVAEGFL